MLLAGMANNPGPSHRITTGNARLVRTDASGAIVWQKDYGGELDAGVRIDASFESVIQSGPDEYVAVGTIAASYQRNETDIYLVKVDGDGNLLRHHRQHRRCVCHRQPLPGQPDPDQDRRRRQ
jgi:hypothetical protein